jgi:sugar-specific transcriptional regulator TrmB
MDSIAKLIEGEELTLIRDFFSLSEYEARAYIALILVGPSGISKLSRITGIPRTKCYSVVKSLVSKGLAMRVSSKPLILDAVNPEIASSKLVEDLCVGARERASRVIEIINKLVERVGARSARKSDQELAGVILIESVEGLLSMLIEDIDNASKEILIATSSMPIEFPWRELLIPSIKAISRGVVIEYTGPRGSPAIRHIKLLLEGHTRISPILQAGMMGDIRMQDILDRFRIYESEHIEAPFIVIDEEVVYNIFTDPIRRAHMFTLRIYNPRYAKSMKIYYRMLTKG